MGTRAKELEKHSLHRRLSVLPRHVVETGGRELTEAEGGLSLIFSLSLLSPSIVVASESRMWCVGVGVALTHLIFRAKHVERENHKTELRNGEKRATFSSQETFFQELDEPRRRRKSERKRLSLDSRIYVGHKQGAELRQISE